MAYKVPGKEAASLGALGQKAIERTRRLRALP